MDESLQAAKVVSEKEEKEKLRDWARRAYGPERLEHRVVQAELLEDLREKGIVNMIEEVVGHEIPPLPRTIEEATIEASRSPLENGNLRVDPDVKKGRRRDEWRLMNPDIRGPILTQEGEWDDKLVFGLDRTVVSPTEPHFPLNEVVTITFNTDKMLKISGQEVVFEAPLPGRPNLDVVEEGIAQATFSPKDFVSLV